MWVHKVNVRIPPTDQDPTKKKLLFSWAPACSHTQNYENTSLQGVRMAEIRVENKSVCLCCGTETSIDHFFVKQQIKYLREVSIYQTLSISAWKSNKNVMSRYKMHFAVAA